MSARPSQRRRRALIACVAAVLLAALRALPAEAQSGAVPPMTSEELQLFGLDPNARVSGGAVPGLAPPDVPLPAFASPQAGSPCNQNGFVSGDGFSIPCGDCWTWQLLPDGLLYPAYLASLKESRIAAQFNYVRNHGWFFDSTLGGHAPLLRYGSETPAWPEGWQLDIEGAAFPRLDPEATWELRSSDFRFGIPLTFRRGHWEGKLAYYHLCAHLGDFYVIEHGAADRIAYVRDAVTLALAYRPWPDLRLYSEASFAFHTDGAARPWEFQVGAEYSPAGPTGRRGAPFIAANSHLRQDNDFSGNVSLQTGWQWRGCTGHLARVGLQYFNGLSESYQFYNQHEDQVGVGLWYDF